MLIKKSSEGNRFGSSAVNSSLRSPKHRRVRFVVVPFVVAFLLVASYLILSPHRHFWIGQHSDGNTPGRLSGKCRKGLFFGRGRPMVPGTLIPCKVEQAKANFDKKQARQSRTVQEARYAYSRRYKRTPPRLFDVWADFALEHNSALIDDYDQIEVDMRPFRKAKFNKLAWQKRISAAKQAEPGEMLGLLSFVDGNVFAIGPLRGTMSVYTLESILAPIAPLLPDMNVLFNWFAEPRVVAPSTKSRLPSDAPLAARGGDQVLFANLSGHPTMDLLSASCPYNGLSTDFNDIKTRDFCQQARKTPQSADWHGFYTAPDHFHPSWSLFPLFSRAKTSVFNDILAPNVCYGHTDYRVWGENDTIPFNNKKKDIYWRGSMTGMSMTPTNWYHGQRHRLVRYVQSMREYITGQKEGNETSIFEADFLNAPWSTEVEQALSRLPVEALNIGFSGTGRGCDPAICNPIKEELPLKSRDLPKEIFQHQFVIDVDGQSMSCRFYSLLESNSVVLKQTIWGEWHDDRLVPWLHYVPIDIDILQHEIPLYLDWFIHATEGQFYAGMIASESRKWAEESLRSIDLTIYFFRLLIELYDIMF